VKRKEIISLLENRLLNKLTNALTTLTLCPLALKGVMKVVPSKATAPLARIS
jgi:hypothetical protein